MVRRVLNAALVLTLISILVAACIPVNAGGSISGRVTWAGEPVAGATVELRMGEGVAATTTTGADGIYTLGRLAAGDYVLWGIWPDGTEGGSSGSVQVTAGEALTGVDIPVHKQMEMVAPTSGERVTAPPALAWVGFPGAAAYRVLVINAGTTELITDEQTIDTTLTVSQPLAAGQTYTWVVQALNANGDMLAELTSEFAVTES